uniref:prostaglandin G/H synthase 1-like n=1 Tax=Myxine glutinosa TaxID=7769 RepID=UPI00358FAD54
MESCTGVILHILLLLLTTVLLSTSGNADDPCCQFPCHHRGVCLSSSEDLYECDCTRTGYGGPTCKEPEFLTRLQNWLRPSPEQLHRLLTGLPWLWDIVNRIRPLRNFLMHAVLMKRAGLVEDPPAYNSDFTYKAWPVVANKSYYGLALPPVPLNCPTPMGTKGPKRLPDASLLAERLLLRRKFIPNPRGSNMLFAFFAQHFTHQFFHTDMQRGPGFTKALGHGVDLNHIYGDSLERQQELRLLQHGKLKFQMVDGEEFPPSVLEARVDMAYPDGIPPASRLAVGHPLYGYIPILLVWSTLWLREHNRVCDILRARHSAWDDEQLFQTARLVLTAETLKIVIEDYVQHLSGYNFRLLFDPTLLFSEPFQYTNRIYAEFNHLYHWHGLMPDHLELPGGRVPLTSFALNTTVVYKNGFRLILESLISQRAGKIGGGHTVPQALLHIQERVIEHGRSLRLQPFNQYRQWLGLKQHQSFMALTGDKGLADELESFYEDVDAVELFVGLLVEKTPGKSMMFGETMIEMGAPFSLKGLMSNPLCSPGYWKPSTFGGSVGFDIVQTASLHSLICRNLPGPCPYVSFEVPGFEEDEEQSEVNVGKEL